MIRLLKKGIVLAEKVRILTLNEDEVLIPEDKHVIPNSNPELVGLAWIDDLYKKLSTIEGKNKMEADPYFGFSCSPGYCSAEYDGDYFSRYAMRVTDDHWELGFRDIIVEKRRIRKFPFNVIGNNDEYHFSDGDQSISQLISYMEKGWKYMKKEKDETYGYCGFDWDFYLKVLELLIEMFPNTNIGVQEVVRKFRYREENYY